MDRMPFFDASSRFFDTTASLVLYFFTCLVYFSTELAALVNFLTHSSRSLSFLAISSRIWDSVLGILFFLLLGFFVCGFTFAVAGILSGFNTIFCRAEAWDFPTRFGILNPLFLLMQVDKQVKSQSSIDTHSDAREQVFHCFASLFSRRMKAKQFRTSFML